MNADPLAGPKGTPPRRRLFKRPKAALITLFVSVLVHLRPSAFICGCFLFLEPGEGDSPREAADYRWARREGSTGPHRREGLESKRSAFA